MAVAVAVDPGVGVSAGGRTVISVGTASVGVGSVGVTSVGVTSVGVASVGVTSVGIISVGVTWVGSSVGASQLWVCSMVRAELPRL